MKRGLSIVTTFVIAAMLVGCEVKASHETTDALGQQAARIERLEQQQKQMQADITSLRASASQWTLWRLSILANPPGWVTKPVAEDAFAAKDDCLSSARLRLENAGAKIIALSPISGQFRDHTDRMYCLPNGVQPLQ